MPLTVWAMAVAQKWGQAGQQTPRDPNKPLIVFSDSYGQHQTWRLAILGPLERANLSRVTQNLHCLALKLQRTCVNLLWRRQTSGSCQQDLGIRKGSFSAAIGNSNLHLIEAWINLKIPGAGNLLTTVKHYRSGKNTQIHCVNQNVFSIIWW